MMKEEKEKEEKREQSHENGVAVSDIQYLIRSCHCVHAMFML